MGLEGREEVRAAGPRPSAEKDRLLPRCRGKEATEGEGRCIEGPTAARPKGPPFPKGTPKGHLGGEQESTCLNPSACRVTLPSSQ